PTWSQHGLLARLRTGRSTRHERGTKMKRRLPIFSVLVVFGALAFGANAGFASVDFNPQTGEYTYRTEGVKIDKGDVVTVRHAGSAGFTSWIRIDYKDRYLGQTYATPNVIKYCFGENYFWACPATKVTVITGHGNDTITVNANVTIPTTLIGGPGSDTVDGGGGSDTLRGGCASASDVPCAGYTDTNDVLHGGNGDDTLEGGPGGDKSDGGRRQDTTHQSARNVSIKASLNDLADDGESVGAGEQDYISNDIEGITGGSNNDILIGNDSANTLNGGPGNDTLRGKLGADVLLGGLGW